MSNVFGIMAISGVASLLLGIVVGLYLALFINDAEKG